jgi:hypothetical protein
MKNLTQLRTTNHKILVLYHFFQKDQSYIDNFSHFLRFGYCADLDFLVIIAGTYSIDLPQASNIRYFFTDNDNYDFGGYAKAIQATELSKSYEFFVFVNSSARGPFLPPYVQESWINVLINLFDERVGIVGAAISLTPKDHAIAKLYHAKYGHNLVNQTILSHVQTTCYVLPLSSLEYLIQLGFYDSTKRLSKDETVRDYEIRLSQLLLANDLNLKCVLPEYNRFDYRTFSNEINSSSREGDSGFMNSYFGRTAHPYESMFIKTSRNTHPDFYLKQLACAMSINHPCNSRIADAKIIEYYDSVCEKSIGSKNQKQAPKYFWQKL